MYEPSKEAEFSASLRHLLQNGHQYPFYPLAELLLQLIAQDPEEKSWEEQGNLLFSTSAELGFPISDVIGLTLLPTPLMDEKKAQADSEGFAPQLTAPQLSLETSFMGLHGAHSPLPSFLLEQISTEDEQGLRKPFLDFFNHRLLTLLYQVWRKYRYYLRFRDNASDNFSRQLFALVGLADEKLRGETEINWCKMLSYAGMLMGRSRSPQVVSGIISHYFDIKKVTIKQWQTRFVTIAPEQKMQLGVQNASLGQDTVIGEKVRDCMGKFVICLHELDKSTLIKFLPSGQHYQTLLTLVSFILREQMAFDLELELKKEDIQPMQLSASNPASLGWFSFVGQATTNHPVCIQMRQ